MRSGTRLDDLIVESPESTWFLQVHGDTMSWAGIHDGDIIVVDRARRPETGGIAVIDDGGELILARAGTRTETAWGAVT